MFDKTIHARLRSWAMVAAIAATLPSAIAMAAAGDPDAAGAKLPPPGSAGDRVANAGSADSTGSPYKKINWSSLVPTGWNPMAGIELGNYSKYGDGDPRATDALKKLQEAWNNAPVNRSLDNAKIRISGYIIPLDAEQGKVKEFLLVPYFGACIHTPPPPPNQIIHVTAVAPVDGLRMMDAVWVNGSMKTMRTETGLGTAGYQIDAVAVAPYGSKR